jgi:hypothetical protein
MTYMSRASLSNLMSQAIPPQLTIEDASGNVLPLRSTLQLGGPNTSVVDDAAGNRIIATISNPPAIGAILNPQPADYSLLGWSFIPSNISTTYATLTSGRVFLDNAKVAAGNINNVSFIMGATAPASLTHAYFGVYQGGNLIAQTADLAGTLPTGWVSGDVKTVALSAAAAVTAGTVQIAILIAGTTVPTIGQAPTGGNASNAGLATPSSAPTSWFMQSGVTTSTALPSALSSLTSWQNGPALWFGLS